MLTALEAEVSGLSLALVPSWPLADRLSLRGKVGLLAWDADVNARGFGVDERFSGEDLLTGIGLEYEFPGGLGLLLEHQEVDLGVGSTSLGLSWQF